MVEYTNKCSMLVRNLELSCVKNLSAYSINVHLIAFINLFGNKNLITNGQIHLLG